jgi:phenylacetic acid degradation operon negative regulatory protein
VTALRTDQHQHPEQDVADVGLPSGATLAPKVQILTIFGSFARQLGNWLATADLIALMADLGYASNVTRSAAARMRKGGIIEPHSHGAHPGYRLTPAALEILADGDARIFHAEIPADLAEGWVLITFTVPERRRNDRHVLRSRLVWLGFGQVSGGVWVAPRRALRDLRRMLDRTGLTPYVSLWEARFLGDAEALVKEAWDLDDLAHSYRNFLDCAGPVADSWRQARPASEAFVDYTRLVSLWRRLPYMDPGLPLELLPSPWAGQDARELFADLDARLKQFALLHVLDVAARRGPMATADVDSSTDIRRGR